MSNFLAWNLQIAIVAAVAAFVPWIVRLRMPAARLLFWQAVLAASLALPILRPWRSAPGEGLVTITSRVTSAVPSGQTFHLPANFWLIVLFAGFATRVGFLLLGLARLRRHRLTSRPYAGDEIRISHEIQSPVTFGFFHPVVILPGTFPDLPESIQEAILCHERCHIRRRDWLFTMAEELIRAVFWFHPGIWWTLGQIQLAREQTVDREVIALTGAPEHYVDALLAVAGAVPQTDLAPAPLFLRRRHLKQRVFSLLKEAAMSKQKSLSTLAAGLGLIAAACWFATAAIPLTAAQSEPKVIRVGGNVQQANLISQPKPVYPPEAKQAHIQGKVELSVQIGTDGRVNNVSVNSGPQELVQSAVDAVSQWVYKPTLLNGEPVVVQTTVDVNYTLTQ